MLLGSVLVDAPGVRDDNSARDAVVKAYLRDGNSIWIVANIKRAVNDKTAKDMLGEGILFHSSFLSSDIILLSVFSS